MMQHATPMPPNLALTPPVMPPVENWLCDHSWDQNKPNEIICSYDTVSLNLNEQSTLTMTCLHKTIAWRLTPSCTHSLSLSLSSMQSSSSGFTPSPWTMTVHSSPRPSVLQLRFNSVHVPHYCLASLRCWPHCDSIQGEYFFASKTALGDLERKYVFHWVSKHLL